MNDAALQSYLLPDETLLWSGKRGRKFRFERKHAPLFFLIPFFLLFLAVAVAGIFAPPHPQTPAHAPPAANAANETSTDTSAPVETSKPPTLLERIFFAFFFLCVTSGFFVFMATAMGLNPTDTFRGPTLYGITSQRLIIVSGKKNKTVESIHLGSLSDLRMKEWPDGLGKITFGPEPTWPYNFAARASSTQLENVANPREVFLIIAQARKSA